MYISARKNDQTESLWQQYVAGDKSKFGELYTFYHKSLIAFCVGKIGNIEQAENVASENADQATPA